VSIVSPRAPGRDALIASATWTIGASRQAYSTSWWWAGDPVDHLERQVVALGDLGADRGVRALDLVVDRLADVVEQAAHLRDLDVGADLGGDDRGEAPGLDRVVEHVLAVARRYFSRPRSLMISGGSPARPTRRRRSRPPGG
jgi:hypothetical protein